MPTLIELQHFIILDLAYTHYDTGLYIGTKTNNPCHLTCYHTTSEPRRHVVTQELRGLPAPSDSYWCFSAYQPIEQDEPGDTIYHTFHFPSWLHRQQKWFAFRGTINAILSPSVSPIFDHTHPGGLPMTLALRPNDPGDLCTIPLEQGWPCPNHWGNVNDIIPDEDLSYVEHVSDPWMASKFDLYNIETAELGAITNLVLTLRVKRCEGTINTGVTAPGIKTHGREYWGPFFLTPLNYADRHKHYPLNPYTNQPWTQPEIDNLQIGVATSNMTIPPWRSHGRCTQAYLTIQRGINYPP